MAILKEVRIRPRFATVDERLGEVKPIPPSTSGTSGNSNTGTSGTSGVSNLLPSQLKGALSDAKIIVSVNDAQTEYTVDLIPVSDPKGALNFKKTTKVDKPLTADELIKEMLTTAGQKKLSTLKSADVRMTAQNYYKIIQDPWQDNPPKVRSFGFDKYYLNNGAEIRIAWTINGKEAELYFDGVDSKTNLPVYKKPSGKPIDKNDWIGGEIWSNSDGIEVETSDKTNGLANWFNPETSKIEVYPETLIKKYVVVRYFDDKKKKEEFFTAKDSTILEFERRPKTDSSTSGNEITTGTSGTSGSSTSGTSGSSTGTSGTSGSSTGTSGTSGSSTGTSGTSGSSTGTSGTSGATKVGFSMTAPTTWSPPIEKINSDKSIIAAIIEVWKKSTPNYENLALCNPDFYPTVEIEYVSPFANDPNDPVNQEALKNNEKYQMNVKLPDLLDVKARVDMPMFSVYFGDIPKIDPDNIFTDEIEQFLQEGDEFTEADFRGLAEEAPPFLPDVPPEGSKIESEGSNQVNPTTPRKSGSFVKLPTGPSAYSHNETQGYNLVDSQWYGDLLTSALAHIDHPTFDIPLTERGNKGCASWVSMVFYRAFGLHLRDGKPVKKIPKAIGDFGSAGTGELGGWFAKNPEMWQQIPWKEGKPGDVINTERKEPKSGHVGIVMDTINSDGSYDIASNSSKGFGTKGDPAGCGRLNYSIKKWASVTERNPERTFCWRWKGKQLEPGKNTF